MPKPLATLSLDLDNLWSYLKIYANPEWTNFPSYLPTFVPLLCDLLNQHRLKITIFIVGQDAALEKNKPWLQQIVSQGHEVANHSFHHDPWMSEMSPEEISDELHRSHEAIVNATGKIPQSFRGPGFCQSKMLLQAVKKIGYRFDGTLFPSSLSPLSRLYYFMHSPNLSTEEKKKRKTLFGPLSNAWKPLKPFFWQLPEGELLEIPVTTLPFLRFPFHFSYLIWLHSHSPMVAKNYFNFALYTCKIFGVQPSILLHPTDFLGGESCLHQLDFFPGMRLKQDQKVEFIGQCFEKLNSLFEVVPMSTFAEKAALQNNLRKIEI